MDIEKIIAEMSIEEKAQLLTGFEGKTKGFEKWGIEPVWMVDGPHGVRKGKSNTEGGCVCFPTSSAIGASWSREVAFKTGEAIGRECRQEDYEMLLAPGVNMKRTPYCGRNFEYFSEDPVLSGHLAAEVINGLESQGIGASLKHYAANNQEYERTTINAEVDERTLREYYLKAFQVALENSKPTSVMCAYNKLGGIWCSENKYLLTEILRDEWGYDGIVVSDWGAVHNACKSIRAGLDLDMPCNKNIASDVKKGLENGEITIEEIDRSVRRMLEFIDRTKKMQKGKCQYSREAQHEAAKKAAEECITLLKNDDDVLPITAKKCKKIGVFGRAAERPVIMGAGSSAILLDDEKIDKPLDFIKKNAAEAGIEVYYSPVAATTFAGGFMGAEDVGELNGWSQGNDFDAMILFVSDNYGLDVETEHWDRENLTFSNYLNGMVESACNACDNVIVVMQTGSAAIPGRWRERVKGVIQMWYAGEAGGSAVADILFGKVNPSAKLSESFANCDRTEMDVSGDGRKTWYNEGMFVGYRYYDKNKDKIWFPFGHGLSYTKFEYSDLQLSSKKSDGENIGLTVSFKVKNVGDMAGKEAVQLYVSHKNSVVLKPEKELKAFDKIELLPGEEKEVSFELNKKDFEYYNICLREWHAESGKYAILIGASSADIRLSGEYEIAYESDYSIDTLSTKYLQMQES